VATHNLGRVVFWMTGALLSFSLTAVSIRGLASTLNVFEILSIRSGFGLLVMTALMLVRPSLFRELKLVRMGLHVWRNASHFTGQYLWAWAVTLLPLATVFALEFTMPMWLALLAIPMLGERMTPSRAGSIVLGLIGVMIIIRPGLGSFQPAALLVLVAAFAFALSLIATKQLTANVSTFAIIFWMNLMQLPMAMSGSDPLFLLRLGESTWLPALALGIAGLTSHYCLTNAFRWGDATVVVPLDFLRIPLIALVGWLFYGEGLDILVFVGAAFIIGGVLWNLNAESRRPAINVAAATEKAHSADA
jgi:drug/metabolite transporter (DMT)-like permease